MPKVIKAKKVQPVTISNNVFTSNTTLQWDAKAVEAVTQVSKALLNLTELFKAQSVTVDAALKIVQDKEE